MESSFIQHFHGRLETNVFFPSHHVFSGHGDIVTVRKVLSDKQESFTFQGKTVKKEEFLMLVRTAGFSVRNPCNVVKQGQISAIAIGGDERR